MRFLQHTRPMAGCFENVVGMRNCSAEGEKSALQVLLNYLSEMNYSAETRELDLATFHQCSRRRFDTCTEFVGAGLFEGEVRGVFAFRC